jgi:acyl carrier protein
MREKIIALIEEELDVHPVTPEMTFEELGMDSLDFICLINDVREKFGPISDDRAQKMNKVSDLLESFC